MTDNTKAGQAELYALLEANGTAYAHHTHPPLFTVEESQALRGELPGGHVKNMFMKDKKGAIWLATCLEHRQIRIRDLEKEVGAKCLSFGKAELLWEVLGVLPGAVTPFGLLNDREAHRVNVALDIQMLEHDPLNFHPLHNEATTAISKTGFLKFLTLTGHTPVMVDFERLEAQERARRAAQEQGQQ
ncbi:MAG: prolyl-tRNA synthetase associated domain-containing protein [Paracoccaceae bacterium]|nr:prolyl-tRNA synthetase associated domain-containing protein [Paracoccaceae bacterium]